jgi:hypothetical protein
VADGANDNADDYETSYENDYSNGFDDEPISSTAGPVARTETSTSTREPDYAWGADDYWGYEYNYDGFAGGVAPIPLPACINGQSGSCIDINEQKCSRAKLLTGYCTGAANIKCCPGEGEVKGKGVSLFVDDDDDDDDEVSALEDPAAIECLNGQAGSCINVESHTCLGQLVLTGVCPGDVTIKCCPRPGVPVSLPRTSSAIGSTTLTPDGFGLFDDDEYGFDGYGFGYGQNTGPSDGTEEQIGSAGSDGVGRVDAGSEIDDLESAFVDNRCYDSHEKGTCIDTAAFICSGHSTVVGFCPGSSGIQCCPGSGLPVRLESSVSCVFVPVLVRITPIASEQRVSELVMSQTYRINSGALEIPGGGTGWWTIADPSKVFASPFEVTDAADDLDDKSTAQALAVKTSNRTVLIVTIVLFIIIVIGGALLMRTKSNTGGQQSQLPTTATMDTRTVMMNGVYETRTVHGARSVVADTPSREGALPERCPRCNTKVQWCLCNPPLQTAPAPPPRASLGVSIPARVLLPSKSNTAINVETAQAVYSIPFEPSTSNSVINVETAQAVYSIPFDVDGSSA